MITVKVLGAACPTCDRLEALVRQCVTNQGLEADVIKVSDYAEMMRYPIVGTPALVINEVVVSSGWAPHEDEILAWLTGAEKA